MKRFLIFALSTAMISASIACGSEGPAVTAPSSIPGDTSVGTSAGMVEKFYTVGGIVQSVDKPFQPLTGARIEAIGGANDAHSAVSGAGGSFSVAVKPGS